MPSSAASWESDILLPYQKQWLEDSSQVAICEKSRRVGLSWVEACAQVMIASVCRGDGGQNCFYLSYNKDMTKQFIEDCGWWARKIGVAAEELEETIWSDPEHPDKDILIYTLRFASGFSIQALPSKPTALRSKQGRVCIDEAAFVEDLPAVIKAAMALLMWGGQVRVVSTHNGMDSPFNELLLECRAGLKDYTIHRIELDEALSQGLYKRICQVAGKKWSAEAQENWRAELISQYGVGAQEELFCMPQGTANRYFPRHLLDSCAIMRGQIVRSKLKDEVINYSPERRESLLKELFRDLILPELKRSRGRVYAGRDFARSGDVSALWFFELLSDSLEHLVLIELRGWPHSMQQRLCELCLEALGHRFAAGAWDARGNGEAEAENLALEFGRIEGVKATTAWYNENFPRLKGRFEDKKISIPADNYVLDDFRAVVVKKGVPLIGERTGEHNREKGRKELRHGDAAVAAVLAEYAYQSDEGGYYPIEFEVVACSEWDGEIDDDEEQEYESWD